MWILVVTFALLVLGESILVGMTAAALCRRLRVAPSARSLVVIFFAVFAFLETFYLPAVRVLDARFEIRNPDFARLIGPGTPIELAEWLSPSLGDPVWWVVQSAIAMLAFRFVTKEE